MTHPFAALDIKTTPRPETSAAPVFDTMSDGLSDPLGGDLSDPVIDSMVAPPVEEETPPPPRAPRVTLKFDVGALKIYSAKNPIYEKIYDRVRSFQDTDMKDGEVLTDEQKLAFAVDEMTRAGIPEEEQRSLLSKVFFGHITPAIGSDYIQYIAIDGGGVTVHFTEGGAPGVEITPITGSIPPSYTGKDDNLRAKRVDAAKNGLISDRGDRVAYTRDSFLYVHHDEVQAKFLRQPAAKEFKELSESERAASPEFRAAVEDYKYFLMLTWVEGVGKLVLGSMENEKRRREADGELAMTAEEYLQFAIDEVRGINNADYFCYEHASLRVEDEAAVEWAFEQLGTIVNLDADSFGASTIEGTPLFEDDLQAIADLEAEKRQKLLDKVEFDKLDADLECTSLALDTLDVMLATGLTKDKVRLDTFFLQRLSPTFPVEVAAILDSGSVSNGYLDSNRTVAFRTLLEAWRTFEHASLNGGDSDASYAAFQSALKTFLSYGAETPTVKD